MRTGAPTRVTHCGTWLSPVLPACERVRRAVGRAVGRAIRGLAALRVRERPRRARQRDALRLRDRRRRGLPVHRGAQLDRASDAERCDARLLRIAVGCRSSARRHAVCRGGRPRERRVSARGGSRHRRAARARGQPAQLFLRGTPGRLALAALAAHLGRVEALAWPERATLQAGSTSCSSSWP
jgi:hypothetical protein